MGWQRLGCLFAVSLVFSSQVDVYKVRSIFHMFDVDSNGIIDSDELSESILKDKISISSYNDLENFYENNPSILTKHWENLTDTLNKRFPFGIETVTRSRVIKRVFDYFDLDCDGFLDVFETTQLIYFTSNDVSPNENYIANYTRLKRAAGETDESAGISVSGLDLLYKNGYGSVAEDWEKLQKDYPAISMDMGVVKLRYNSHDENAESKIRHPNETPRHIVRMELLGILMQEISLKTLAKILSLPTNNMGDWKGWTAFSRDILNSGDSSVKATKTEIKEMAKQYISQHSLEFPSEIWRKWDANNDFCLDHREISIVPQESELISFLSSINPTFLSRNINRDTFEAQKTRAMLASLESVSGDFLSISGNLDNPGDNVNLEGSGGTLDYDAQQCYIAGTCAKAADDVEDDKICATELRELECEAEASEILSMFDINMDSIVTYDEFWERASHEKDEDYHQQIENIQLAPQLQEQLDKISELRCESEVLDEVIPQSLPKVVHQTWKSSENIPLQVAPWMASWILQNEDWKHAFWSDDDNRNLVRDKLEFLLPYLDILKPVEQADICRYLYLFFFGGVYADMDFEALHPMDTIRDTLDDHEAVGFLGEEPRSHTRLLEHKTGLLISNAILGSPSHHPFWLALVANIVVALALGDRGDPVSSTGPRILTSIYKRFYCIRSSQRNLTLSLREAKPDILTMPDDWFYPEVAMWNIKGMLAECRTRSPDPQVSLRAIDRDSKTGPPSKSIEIVDLNESLNRNAELVTLKDINDVAAEDEIRHICRKIVRIALNHTAGHTHNSLAAHHWMCSWCRGIEDKGSIALSEFIPSDQKWEGWPR